MYLTEAERIQRWNEKCFREQGFGESAVAMLSAWKVDPHDSADLISAGCPHPIAMRILQPVDDFVVLAAEPEFSVKV